MKKPSTLNRRSFIQNSSMAAAAGVLAPHILRGQEATIATDPVRVAQIGIGTRGVGLLSVAGSKKNAHVVALCDVYKPHLERGIPLANNPNVKTYGNYREMLNDPKIEAVIIATPDHWHEKMLIDCIAAGKDVYCEKGWTTSIESAKRMRKAVKDAGKIMQLGHQGRQHVAADEGRKLIEEELIGQVTKVMVGRYLNGTAERPPWRWYSDYANYVRPDPTQVIKYLDWEQWLGACPKIDFNERHFWHWRCYGPYGTGQCGDLLSHEMDHVQSVLRYGIPDTCVSQARVAFWHDDRESPDTWASSFAFEKQNCIVTYEGSMASNRGQSPEYIGNKGRITYNSIGQNATQFETFSDEVSHRIARHPRAEPTGFFTPTKEHRRPDHMEEFFNSVRTREKTRCNEDEAFIETAVLVMAMEAYKQKRQVRWDAEKELIV